MKITTYRHIGTLLLALAICGACSDSDATRVYFPDAKSVQIKNFEIADEPYELEFTVAVTGSDYATVFGKEVSGDVNISLSVDPAKVTEYNTLCKTDFPILPQDCYTLSTVTTIPSGSAVSNPVKLVINAKGKIEPFDSYLLPITINAVEGAEADNIQQTLYYLLSGAADVSEMPFADRSLWEVIDFSSEEASGEGPGNGKAIYAFDGNNDTFWHTQWSGGEPQPPHHVTVDMGETVRMLGFSYFTRDHGRAWPTEIVMETSLDGSKWEDAGTFSDLPESGATEYRSYFAGFKTARYFRFTITAVHDGSWSTHVAEINAFCKQTN